MSKIAFMFPGQGAQKAGMGKDFYEQSETASDCLSGNGACIKRAGLKG